MSKLTTTVEKLTYFTTKWTDLNEKNAELQKQAQELDKEWTTFAETNLNLKSTGTIHVSQVIKNAIEKTYEPTIIKG